MDFLKSAVATAIAKGSSLPYTLGDQVENYESLWTLHNATKKDDGSACSIFTFDVRHNKSRLPLARNAVRKLRTLRHPGIVKVYDTIETETSLSIVAERITPLAWHIRRKCISNETAKWGLCTVASTVKFINNDATSVHGNIRSSSIYTSESGEWKVAGLEALSSMKDDEAIIYNYGSLLPDSARFAPPEVANDGWTSIKKNPLAAADSFGLGILIFEVFTSGFRGADQLSQTKAIPSDMVQIYRRLVNNNPKARISAGHFVDQGRKSGGFFETPLIRFTADIDNLGLQTDVEREKFLSELGAVSDDFPEEFFRMKVLPELLKAVEFGGGGPKVFEAALTIGSKLADDEYETKLIPVIIRLFASPDRAMRVCLLDNLATMIPRLSSKDVSNKIFPSMVTGFTDVAPIVREQTVKAVLTIVGKLTDRIVNGELLRYLAKAANDDQPGIRTNTTICLGKIARNLGTGSRSKVLVAAFTRSLRDPFVHARNAGLMALSATIDVFSHDECATKILPSLCASLLDKEKIVRDQANKTLDLYLLRVRKHAATMADTALAVAEGATIVNPSTTRMENSGDTSWAGWAISSFTNKLTTARGEIQPALNGPTSATQNEPRSASIPLAGGERSPASLPASNGTAAQIGSEINGSTSPPTSAHDLDDTFEAWCEMEEEEEERERKEDEGADSFFDLSSSHKKPASPLPSTRYDQEGEPDFAGWLAAQSQAKSKKPLPKGLSKSSTLRPNPADRTMSDTTGSSVNAKKMRGSTLRPKVNDASKKIDTAPREADLVDDEWGDDWD